MSCSNQFDTRTQQENWREKAAIPLLYSSFLPLGTHAMHCSRIPVINQSQSVHCESDGSPITYQGSPPKKGKRRSSPRRSIRAFLSRAAPPFVGWRHVPPFASVGLRSSNPWPKKHMVIHWTLLEHEHACRCPRAEPTECPSSP